MQGDVTTGRVRAVLRRAVGAWAVLILLTFAATGAAAGGAQAVQDDANSHQVTTQDARRTGVFYLNTSTGQPYANAAGTGFQDEVVAEAFKRIGLTGKVVRYKASARALINANSGVDQGVAMRVKGLEKTYPNLIRVPEVLVENEFVAYSKGRKFRTDSWSSLLPYVVAYINGWVIFERNLGQSQEKHAVKTPEQLFTMLEKGHTDVILYERWQGLFRARQSGIKVNVHEPPLAKVNMYMYLNKEYADLVPKLAEALRSMKADGTYQAIFDRTLKVLARD